MKGEALITIKTKDGKIKQQVKKSNLVFDLPKEAMKRIISNVDIGSLKTAGSYQTSNVGYISNFSDWFGSIQLNDELCDTTDYKDFKFPILYGGETTSANSSRSRYAYIDTANSSKTNNIMKKSYTWNNCPAFTLRSINLKRKEFSTQQFGIALPYYWFEITKCKNIWFTMHFSSSTEYNDNYRLGISRNSICMKNPLFNWNNNRKDFTKILQVAGFSTTGSGTSPYNTSGSIIPLKNDEIALLRNTNEITTDNSSSQIKYLHIINANDGTLKRSFPLTQFDGFVGYSSSNNYIDNSYISIVATDFGSFIVMSKTNSNSNVFVWKIPEQSEMSDYSNNEAISVYADLSSTGFTNGRGMIIIGNCMIRPNNTVANEITIRINNDSQNPYTVFNYSGTNGSISSNSRLYANKYCELFMGNIMYNYTDIYFETWYNTTVLNLSEGVEVAQGDTVTIEYTITAN